MISSKTDQKKDFDFPDPDLSIFNDPEYIKQFKKEVEEYKEKLKNYQRISEKTWLLRFTF